MQDFILTYGLMFAGIFFTSATIIISETGKIFLANTLFLIGDLIYLFFAIALNNTFGTISLGVAVVFAARTLYKMFIGIYHKDLKKELQC